MLNTEELEWLKALVVDAVEKHLETDPNKEAKVKAFLAKIDAYAPIYSGDYLIITGEDYKLAGDCKTKAKEYAQEYASILDLGGVQMYDGLKKRITADMSFHSSVMNKFRVAESSMKDYVTHTLVEELAEGLLSGEISTDTKKPSSLTAARTKSKTLEQYKSVMRQYYKVYRERKDLEFKYHELENLLQSVRQSVSTAKLEENSQRHGLT